MPGHDDTLDFDALERVLSRIPDAMPLPWALGLITGSLSAPTLSNPVARLQEILGTAALESTDHVMALMQALTAVHNELADRLEADRPAGPPRRDDAFVTAWCSGYVEAFSVDRDDLGDADLAYLFPFAVIAGEVGVRGEDGEADPARTAVLEGAAAAWKERLDELVDEAHEHFREARLQNVPGGRSTTRGFGGRAAGRGETYRRTAPKIGRNEPCPCGSGKKYKRCCGAAEG